MRRTRYPYNQPRMQWTEALHRRFMEAWKMAGDSGQFPLDFYSLVTYSRFVRSATPKLILQRMNVKGLTRQHVSSHLQHYRNKMHHNRSILTFVMHEFHEQSTPIPQPVAPDSEFPCEPHPFLESTAQNADSLEGEVSSPILRKENFLMKEIVLLPDYYNVDISQFGAYYFPLDFSSDPEDRNPDQC